MAKKFLWQCLCLFFAALSWAALASDTGSIRGSASVSNMGSGRYTLPLRLPLGVNGLTPKLAYVYDSNNKSLGVLGQGWSLAGVSQIQRCGTALRQNGFNSKNTYSEQDGFCLNGERLIEVASTASQAAAKEYRPELSPEVRVLAFGEKSGAPEWFQVEQRDGKIYEYGKADHAAWSITQADGGATTVGWGISKVVDPYRNVIHYQYGYNSTISRNYLRSIQYNDNEQAPTRSPVRVEFEYDSFPDGFPVRYVAGSAYIDGLRLNQVVIQAAGQSLTYVNQWSDDASKLLAVKLCADQSSCIPATVIEWDEPEVVIQDASLMVQTKLGEVGIDSYDALPGPLTDVEGNRIAELADYNGDGLLDYWAISGTNSQPYIQVRNSRWRLAQGEEIAQMTLPKAFEEGVAVVDLDGDGFSEWVDLKLKQTATGKLKINNMPEGSKFSTVENPLGGFSVRASGAYEKRFTFSIPNQNGEGLKVYGSDLASLAKNFYGIEDQAWAEPFLRAYGWIERDGVIYMPTVNGNIGVASGGGLDLPGLHAFHPVESNLRGMLMWAACNISSSRKITATSASVEEPGPHFGPIEDDEWVVVPRTALQPNKCVMVVYQPSSFSVPVQVKTPASVDYQCDLNTCSWVNRYHLAIDLNADGLTDSIRSIQLQDDKASEPVVSLHSSLASKMPTGSIEQKTSAAYRLPELIYKKPNGSNSKYASYYERNGVRLGEFADINGDGLPDYVTSIKGFKGFVLLNTGKGWSTEKTCEGQIPWLNPAIDKAATKKLMDLDGDRVPEIVSTESKRLVVSKLHLEGDQCRVTQLVNQPVSINGDLEPEFKDLNGDGLTDLVWPGKNQVLVLSNFSQPRALLSSVTEGDGRKVQFEYEAYTPRLSGKPMGGLHNVVKSYQVASASYKRFNLGHGVYNESLNQFVGFKSIGYRELHGAGFIRYFATNFPFVGRIQKEELFQNSYKTQVKSYEYDDFSVDSLTAASIHQVRLSKTLSQIYDQETNSLLRSLQTELYDFNEYGDPSLVVTTDRDELNGLARYSQVNTQYTATNLTDWQLPKVSAQATENSDSYSGLTRQANTRLDYDPVTGVLTDQYRQPDKLGTSEYLHQHLNYDTRGEVSAVVLKGYDANGNALMRQSQQLVQYLPGQAVRKVSTYDALDQLSETEYSILHGVVVKQTGVDGLAVQQVLDGFGRPVETKLPDGTAKVFTRNKAVLPLNGESIEFTQVCEELSAQDSFYAGSGAVNCAYSSSNNRYRVSSYTGFDGSEILTAEVLSTSDDVAGAGRVLKTSNPFSVGETPVWAQQDFDVLGRLHSQTLPAAHGGTRYINYQYSPLMLIQSEDNRYTQTRFNAFGGVASIQESGLTEQQRHYGPVGELVAVDDGLGRTTRIIYDDLGRRIGLETPETGKTVYRYNSFGEMEYQRNANGQVVFLTYDPIGRLAQRKEPEGITSWHYQVGQAGVPDPGAGRLQVVKMAGGYSREYGYDQFGRNDQMVVSINQADYTFSTSYDELSRPQRQIQPDGIEFVNHYNAFGHLEAISTPQTHLADSGIAVKASQLEQELAELQLQIEQVQARATELIEHAQRFKAKALLYARVEDRFASYAERLLQIAEQLEDKANSYREKAEQYHTKADNLAQQAQVYWAQYQHYSASAQAYQKRFASRWLRFLGARHIWLARWKAIVARSKALAAERAQAAAEGRAEKYESQADKLDQKAERYEQIAARYESVAARYRAYSERWLAESQQALSQANKYIAQLNTLKERYQTLQAELAALKGQANLAEGDDYIWWQATGKDRFGKIEQLSFGNKTEQHTQYDPATAQTLNLSYQNANNSTAATGNMAELTGWQYQYNSNGNTQQRCQQTTADTLCDDFDYDALYQLDNASISTTTGTAQTLSWQYDAIGNISYASNGMHEKLNGIQTDPVGNITAYQDKTLQWTSFNKPKQLSSPQGTTQWQYGPERQRLITQESLGRSSQTTVHITAGYERLTQNGQTPVTRHLIYAQGKLVATLDNPEQGAKRIHYYRSDAQGSINQITDQQGQVKASYQYGVFGQRHINQQSDTASINPFGYTGHRHLHGEAIIDMGGRVFSPELGRFLSADPYVAYPDSGLGWNRYAYTHNNPLRYTDPSGFNVLDEIGEFFVDTFHAVFDVIDVVYEPLSDLADYLNLEDFIDYGYVGGEVATFDAPSYQSSYTPDYQQQYDNVASWSFGHLSETIVEAPIYETSSETTDFGTGQLVLVASNDGVSEGHRSNKRESNRSKHERGDSRRSMDRGGEKGDAKRRKPRVRPPNWKGPWPPLRTPFIICPVCTIIDTDGSGYIPEVAVNGEYVVG